MKAGAVAIVAPGGYDSDPARLARAIDYFERNGLATRVAFDPEARHGRFSGTDDARLAALEAAVADPAIDVVIALRGGYGATRLLPRLDFEQLARSGKRFVGHSDFTAVELALLATTGAISYAGPMASFDFGGDAIDPFTERCFWQAMRESTVDFEFETDAPASLRVDGPLWGGNLAMVISLIGTPWMPRVDDGILFLEDVGERPFRIERMLLQLHQAGIVDRQKAILLGDLSGGAPVPYDNGYGVDDAIAQLRGVCRVPVLTGLPFGHVTTKATFAVGAPASVEAMGRRCRFRQRWAPEDR